MITPSIALTATERVLPRLALDFTTGALDPRITFTRSGNTATRINASGAIESVNADTPRFDYDPVTLACKGLLIEEQRQNTATYSNEFDNAIWVKTALTNSSNVVTSPDGTSNADALYETTDNNAHFLSQTIALSGTKTFSVYGKTLSSDRYLKLSGMGLGAVSEGVVFNLSNGTVSLPPANTRLLSASISNAGNGWYRCSIVVNSTVGNPSVNCTDSLTDFGFNPYIGDPTKGIYVWGAQLEAGAFATSYIPTTSAALTRNADVVTMTGTNFSSWYNQSAGTFVADGFFPPVFSTFPTTWGAVSDGTNQNRIQGYAYTGGAYTNVRVSNVGQGDPGVLSSIAVNSAYRMVSAYATNNLITALNGAVGAVDTTATIPTVNQLQIGANGADAGQTNSCIKRLFYYPSRLTNAEVQAFSK